MKTNHKNDFYNESFYDLQMDGSYRSAVQYVKHLSTLFSPRSVVDLGCGRGTWLKAFGESGATSLVGFDGFWNNQSKMVDQKISFNAVDLNAAFCNVEKKFDLAMSLEVAEHLNSTSAKNFVSALVNLSDVVLFGAAYCHQGGADHINEQPHSYWAKMFSEFGYVPYDLFRPHFWGNPDVEVWYQQNTFLYVRNDSPLNKKLNDSGLISIDNISFMNCIHPHLFEVWVSRANRPFNTVVKKLFHWVVPSNLSPIARNIRSKMFG